MWRWSRSFQRNRFVIKQTRNESGGHRITRTLSHVLLGVWGEASLANDRHVIDNAARDVLPLVARRFTGGCPFIAYVSCTLVASTPDRCSSA